MRWFSVQFMCNSCAIFRLCAADFNGGMKMINEVYKTTHGKGRKELKVNMARKINLRQTPASFGQLRSRTGDKNA